MTPTRFAPTRFVYDGDGGVEWFRTKAAAQKYFQDTISQYRIWAEDDGEWDPGVERIRMGIVSHDVILSPNDMDDNVLGASSWDAMICPDRTVLQAMEPRNIPAIKSYWDQDRLSWGLLVIATMCAGVAIGLCVVDGTPLEMISLCVLAGAALSLLSLYHHRRARVALRSGTSFSSFSSLLEAEGGDTK